MEESQIRSKGRRRLYRTINWMAMYVDDVVMKTFILPSHQHSLYDGHSGQSNDL